MKNVSISLTDQHAAEIEAQVASGDFASVSEVVRAALRDFLGRAISPSPDQIDRDIAVYLSDRESGAPLISGAEALSAIRTELSE